MPGTGPAPAGSGSQGTFKLPLPEAVGGHPSSETRDCCRDAGAGEGAGLAAGKPDGDRTEINLNGPIERSVWSRLSAEDEGCRLEVCLKRTGAACPFYRAKIAAENAHILVVNHALLLADTATGNKVLPEFDYLIVDEAHHLESATTSAMSFKVRAVDITRLVRELGGLKTGLLGRFVETCEGLLQPAQMAALHQLVQKAADLAFRFDSQMTTYFQSMSAFLEEQREGRSLGTYPQQERVGPSTRTLPIWVDVEIAWELADETLKSLMEILRDLRTPMRELADQENDDAEDMWGSLGNMFTRCWRLNTISRA